MKKTESEVLADVYEGVRNLSKMFLAQLKNIDINKQLEINNVKFNSAYWIVAHLVWTEHFLLIEGVGGENMKIEWIEDYGFGTNPDEIKIKPEYDEILKTMDEVHIRALEIIKNLSDEQLEEDNYINATFGSSRSKRNIIKHAIRHEPMHIGQISWILKTNGMKFA